MLLTNNKMMCKSAIRGTKGFSFLLLAFCFVTLSCKKKSETTVKAGIAISFDDHFINDWYALRPLFQKYNAKVTFFVTCGDSFSADEIAKLKQLRLDGHEIGFHGTIHSRSTNLMEAFGPEKYAEMELDSGMGYMKAAGFNPTSYAHPGGNHNERVDSVLYSRGFVILRDVAQANRVFKGIPLYSIAPRVMSWIYYGFDKSKAVDALIIDQDSGISDDEMNDAIRRAKETNTALMLFGHQPLYSAPKNGAYGFKVSFLEKILKEARRQNLKFYTMSELPQQ
jgi:peptidoglycan-N-acetylglucosamine deacetylase